MDAFTAGTWSCGPSAAGHETQYHHVQLLCRIHCCELYCLQKASDRFGYNKDDFYVWRSKVWPLTCRWCRKTNFSTWGRDVSQLRCSCPTDARGLPHTCMSTPQKIVTLLEFYVVVNWHFGTALSVLYSRPISHSTCSAQQPRIWLKWRRKPQIAPQMPWGPGRIDVNVLFLTSALDGSGLLKPHPVRLTPGASSTEGWWAPVPVWTDAQNLAPRLHRDSIPGPSSP